MDKNRQTIAVLPSAYALWRGLINEPVANTSLHSNHAKTPSKSGGRGGGTELFSPVYTRPLIQIRMLIKLIQFMSFN